MRIIISGRELHLRLRIAGGEKGREKRVMILIKLESVFVACRRGDDRRRSRGRGTSERAITGTNPMEGSNPIEGTGLCLLLGALRG